MNQPETIKRLFERAQTALRQKPYVGRKTATSKTRLVDGTTCEVTEGKWSIAADLSEKIGGSGRGPDPGVLGRAAFGSCAALSYVQWAAVLDVTIDSLEVVVETDADNSGYYAVDDVPAGYLRARSLVRIDSPDPLDKVIEMLDKGDKHSPYHDLWSRALEIERTVILNGEEI